jgi:hypothetical protein
MGLHGERKLALTPNSVIPDGALAEREHPGSSLQDLDAFHRRGSEGPAVVEAIRVVRLGEVAGAGSRISGRCATRVRDDE